MRTPCFQQPKISMVLYPLSYSDSHLLNIFQFSNLLMGMGKGWTYLRAVLTWRNLKYWMRGKNYFPCYAGYTYCDHQAGRQLSWHSTDSCLNSHSALGLLWKSCFVASHSPAYAVAWGYASPGMSVLTKFHQVPHSQVSWGPFEC